MYKYLFIDKSLHDALDETIRVLNHGGLICAPTETVYGIICSANNTSAIEALYEVKGRSKSKPYALFTDTLERVYTAGAYPSQLAEKLADAFWPGALTLVMKAKPECPCSFQESVGVRSPDTEFLQKVIKEFDGLLVNTSFNRSGEPPVWEIREDMTLLQQMDLILDGGKLPLQPPSTVINCRGMEMEILREGAISREEIEERLL